MALGKAFYHDRTSTRDSDLGHASEVPVSSIKHPLRSTAVWVCGIFYFFYIGVECMFHSHISPQGPSNLTNNSLVQRLDDRIHETGQTYRANHRFIFVVNLLDRNVMWPIRPWTSQRKIRPREMCVDLHYAIHSLSSYVQIGSKSVPVFISTWSEWLLSWPDFSIRRGTLGEESPGTKQYWCCCGGCSNGTSGRSTSSLIDRFSGGRLRNRSYA